MKAQFAASLITQGLCGCEGGGVGANYTRNTLSQIQTWPDITALVVVAKQVESAGALSPKDEWAGAMERCGGKR